MPRKKTSTKPPPTSKPAPKKDRQLAFVIAGVSVAVKVAKTQLISLEDRPVDAGFTHEPPTIWLGPDLPPCERFHALLEQHVHTQNMVLGDPANAIEARARRQTAFLEAAKSLNAQGGPDSLLALK